MKDRPLSRSGLCGLGLTVLAIWMVLLFVAAQSTLWDRDEARYGTAALEMYTSGNFLYPTFNHELRAFQPVLVYWLMAGGIHLLGPGELAVRLPSTLAMAAVCLLAGLIARAFGVRPVMAAAIAGTSPMVLLTGTAATTDATLLLFILLAEATFVHAWLYGPRRWQVPVLGLAIGLAMLTKGPVGLAVPLLSIGTALVLARGRSAAGPFAAKLVWAVLLGLAIFLAWGLPANAATGGDYWRIAIVERLPQRLFTAMENHGGQGLVPFLLHLPYYPMVLLVGFLPWTLYLVLAPGAFAAGSAPETPWARSPAGLRVLLTGMILPTVVLMTLIVSKLPHYLQPIFPWLAILVAWTVCSHPNGSSSAVRMRWAFWVLAPPAALIALALLIVPLWSPLFEAFRPAGLALGLLILGTLTVLGWAFHRGRLTTAVGIHAALMVCLLLVIGFTAIPELEKTVKPAQSLARQIRDRLPAQATIASFGWFEPGMHFYLGAPRIASLHNAGALDQWLTEPGKKILLVKGPLPPAVTGTDWHVLGQQTGIDHVRGGKTVLTALARE